MERQRENHTHARSLMDSHKGICNVQQEGCELGTWLLIFLQKQD